jgi:hypothetical protein
MTQAAAIKIPPNLHRPRRKGEFSFDGPIRFDGPVSITPGGEFVPRNRPARLCGKCLMGEHSVAHTELGCLRTVRREPMDYVCDCEVVG